MDVLLLARAIDLARGRLVVLVFVVLVEIREAELLIFVAIAKTPLFVESSHVLDLLSDDYFETDF